MIIIEQELQCSQVNYAREVASYCLYSSTQILLITLLGLLQKGTIFCCLPVQT